MPNVLGVSLRYGKSGSVIADAAAIRVALFLCCFGFALAC